MRLKVKRLHENAKLPTRAHNSDCGYDLYSIVDLHIKPHETVKIRTGIAVQIEKDKDDYSTYMIKIEERSSLGSIGFGKRAGIVDEGYTNELIVCMTNHNEHSTSIGCGQKIAQFLIHKIYTPHIEEVEELSDTDRGLKGFGSSGL